MWLLCSFLCFFLISSSIADTCRNPTLVKHSGYSTTDSFFNAKTAIVIEFSVNCDQPVKEYPLYWEYEGDVHLAAQLPTGLHYQITFVNDHKKIGRGQYDIRIFDEEGFAALRKAMRAKVDTNDAVKPLFTVSYYHPKVYTCEKKPFSFVVPILQRFITKKRLFPAIIYKIRKKSMKHLECFDIILNSDTNQIFAGTVFSGHLVIALTVPIRIGQLVVAFTGEMRTKWVDKVSENIFDSVEPIVNFKTQMYLNERGTDDPVEPGNYSLPFQFTLPLHLPSSFQAEFGFIRYVCFATATILPGQTCSMATTKQCKEFKVEKEIDIVDVVRFQDLRHVGRQRPVQAEECFELIGCCRKQGRIEALIRLDEGVFLVGDTILAKLEIQNCSRRRPLRRCSLFLLQEALFHAQSFHGTTSSNRTLVKVLDVASLQLPHPGDRVSQNVELHIPQNTQPSSLDAPLIRLSMVLTSKEQATLFADSTPPPIASLKSLTCRAIAIKFVSINFGNDCSFGKNFSLKCQKPSLNIVVALEDDLWNWIKEAVNELQAWLEKIASLFVDLAFEDVSGYLMQFIGKIHWRRGCIEVDEVRTVEAIINTDEICPRFAFQLFCAYAMVEKFELISVYYLRQLEFTLPSHPLYHFWFYVIFKQWNVFNELAITTRMLVSNVFTWAMYHGFVELTEFLWCRMNQSQLEMSCVIHWNRFCKNATNGRVFAYLCNKLCQRNENSICRMTIACFFRTVQRRGFREGSSLLAFLLINGCAILKARLFEAKGFEVLRSVVKHFDFRLYRILELSISPDQLEKAVRTLRPHFTKEEFNFFRSAQRRHQFT
ncbi:putative translocon-associated protein subunit delta [Trichinella spiralis]|uniref:putative translocon-associated protein subunit delta n=1 Tax=Trichinella spiralis TaxID=6334 RepID=UPI0001EFE97B|nr:putative translocon-associated protein subunit delta [Trichinella spiralis]